MEEYYIRILLISEIEKNYNLSWDIGTTKFLTLINCKSKILSYINQKYQDYSDTIVKPNTIEDYLIDNLNGLHYSQTEINAESVYLEIHSHILEFIDDYIEKIKIF